MTVSPEAVAAVKAAPTPTGVTPYLMVKDSDACSAFYQKAFAAEEVARIPMEDGKRVMHMHLRINGGSFMFNDPMPEYGYPFKEFGGFTLHIQVPQGEGDAWWKRAIDAGCTEVMPFQLQFWGDRYGNLTDPFGISWSIGETAER
jgi:uncharacterized glyoxalase superfamily protein PhnB